MSQNDTSYFHIGSKICVITNLRYYNVGKYASGTDIVMNLRPFVLIAYIFGFRNDRQIVEYTKDKLIYQENHDLLQWNRNAQNIFRFVNELELINFIRE